MTTCIVATCTRERQRDSLFCHDCLNEMWANRLEKRPDGTYGPKEPEWMRRRRTVGLPAKDMTSVA